MNRSLHRVAGLVLGAWIALSGCGKQGDASDVFVDTHPLPRDTMTIAVPSIGSYGGRFVFGETSGPKTFNGLMANESSSTDITSRMFVGLTDYDNATQQVTAALAKSWEMAADRLTWTFHLRRGAAFSDGHPITSADVLFSFAVAYDSIVHPSVQDLLMMNGKKWDVSAPDSYTVVIKTPSPNGMLVELAGQLVIMPKHTLAAAYRTGSFASAYAVSMAPDGIVTSGPWRVQQYVPNEKVVLSRNPYWYGVDPAGHRLPYLNQVVYEVVPDQDALDLKFRSGEVDGLDNPKPENYQWYTEHQQEGHFKLYDLGPSLTSTFFWFNLNRVHKATPGKALGDVYVDPVKYAWFDNVAFRRAVSKAIDRQAIIRSVYFSKGVANWTQATPGNKQWYSADIVHDDYDPAGAKQLLASLGMKDRNGDGILEDSGGHPVAFTLSTNADNKMRVAMGDFIRDDLAKVGIKVTLVPMDFNTLITRLREDFQYDAMLLGITSSTPPDPGIGQNFMRSSGRTHYWNMAQPKPETPQEAQIDHLMDVLIGTPDLDARLQAWRQIETIVNQMCWIEWLPVLDLQLPVRDRFGNLQPSALQHRLLWNIDRVYVRRPAKPA